MPSEYESRMRRWNPGCRRVACTALSVMAFALVGCEQQAADQAVLEGLTTREEVLRVLGGR